MPRRDSGSKEPHHNESADREESSSSSSGGFSLTVDDLAPLTDPTNPTSPSELGGIDGICKALKVDPKVGLRTDEASGSSLGKSDQPKFEARSKQFGRNVSSQPLDERLASKGSDPPLF